MIPGTISASIPAAATASRKRKKVSGSKKNCVIARVAPASSLRFRLSRSAAASRRIRDGIRDRPRPKSRTGAAAAAPRPAPRHSRTRRDAARNVAPAVGGSPRSATMWRTPAAQYSSATCVDLVARRLDAGQVRRRGHARLALDPRHRRVGPLARRSARAIGHRHEARRRAAPASGPRPTAAPPSSRSWAGRIRSCTSMSPADVGEQRRVERAARLLELVDRKSSCRLHLSQRRAPALRPSHNFTVSSPPSSVSIRAGCSPAASNQPAICSSAKPSRVCASRARSSSRSCGAKSAISSRPPGAQHPRRLGDRGARLLREVEHVVEDRDVRRAVAPAAARRDRPGAARHCRARARQLRARQPQHLRRPVDPQRASRARRRTAPASARCRCRCRSACRPAPSPSTAAIAASTCSRRRAASGSRPIRRHAPRTTPPPTPRDRRAPPPAAPRRRPPSDRARPRSSASSAAAHRRRPRRASPERDEHPAAFLAPLGEPGVAQDLDVAADRAAGSAPAPAPARRPTAPSTAAAPGCAAASRRPARGRCRGRSVIGDQDIKISLYEVNREP